ncbi:hypothetical protein ACMAUO_08715 [Gluconacetobacter sp. Hr-1-5]
MHKFELYALISMVVIISAIIYYVHGHYTPVSTGCTLGICF